MLRLRCSFPYPRFVIQITENMFTIFYAAIFACRMPTPSLWIFLKDLSVFKITEKCSICYHFFLFRMYCLVTRSSKYSLVIRILENMLTWLIYDWSGSQWVSYVVFPICLFESNWRNSHILSLHSYIIFTVLDLKFPIPCQINPKCREPFFENFVIFTDPKTYFKFSI